MPRKAAPTPLTDDLDTTLERVALTDLRPHPRNYQHHSDEEIDHLRASIRLHDIYRNVVIAREGTILAGHGVITAAGLEGRTHILAMRKDYDPMEPRALQIVVGDNEIARLALKSEEGLATLLQDLSRDDPLALLGTGFDEATLAALVEAQGLGNVTGTGDAGRDVPPAIDRAEELREKWGVETGSLWICGEHRLICGDGTDKAVMAQLLGDRQPDILIADPPYGMALDTSYANSVDNLRKGIRKSRGYARVLGDEQLFDPTPVFGLTTSIQEQFWWGADYYRAWLPTGGSWLVWDKRASVEMVDYSSSEFELCWSRTPHHRTILRVPWFGLIGTEQQDIPTRLHPTQKPLGVIDHLLKKHTAVGAFCYDPFLGSGTTLVSCENLGRTCYGCEIDHGYVAVTLERWHTLTGEMPTRLT